MGDKSTRKEEKRKETWNMTVAELLKKRNATWDEARRIAKNRTNWKKIVHQKR